MKEPPGTLADEVVNARRGADIVARLGRYLWQRDNSGEPCLPDRIPIEADLAEWLPHCPPEALAEAAGRGARCLPPPGADKFPPRVGPWEPWRWCVSPGGQLLLMRTAEDMAVDAYELECVHAAWAGLPDGERPPHPLGPIIQGWQRRPRRVEPDRRPDRIFPSRFAMIAKTDHRGERDLFSPAAHFVPGVAGRQLTFGFERDIRGPALPLTLYSLGPAGNEPRRGGGGGAAPVALRLWIEGLLSARKAMANLSPGTSLTFEIPLRELMQVLWPGTHPRPGDYLPQLHAASRALDSDAARIPYADLKTGDPVDWRIVTVSGLPRIYNPKTSVSITVTMPPGAGAGPTMPVNLNAWGAYSETAYIGLINLGFRWFRPGATRFPVRGGKHWLQADDPARYPDLSDDDVLDIFAPLGTRKKRRDALADANRAVAKLAAAGGLKVEGRKLIPPPAQTPLQPPPRRRRRGD